MELWDKDITTSYPLRVKPVTSARKAPTEQQERDKFQTPAYATKLLLPFIPKEIKAVWECAAGEGRISRIFREAGYSVFESDLKENGKIRQHNFIDGNKITLSGDIAIITNPPFSIKDLFVEKCFEYEKPFALLMNMDYSQQMCEWILRGCQKIVPNSRIAYITPNVVKRVNEGKKTKFKTVDDIPNDLLYKYSNAQFHSGWLTYGFGLPSSETIVELTLEQRHDIK